MENTQRRKGARELLGKYMRLRPLTIDELPLHPDLPASTSPRDTAEQDFDQAPIATDFTPPDEAPQPSAINGPTSVPSNKFMDGILDLAISTQAPLPVSASSEHPDTGKDRRPSLPSFVRAVFGEAYLFMDHTLSGSFRETGTKPSQPSTAKVQLLSRKLGSDCLTRVRYHQKSTSRAAPTGDERKAEETWHARRSVHEDEAKPGSASMQEFDEGILQSHSENEMAYTPDVYDARRVLDWRSELADLNADLDIEIVDIASKRTL